MEYFRTADYYNEIYHKFQEDLCKNSAEICKKELPRLIHEAAIHGEPSLHISKDDYLYTHFRNSFSIISKDLVDLGYSVRSPDSLGLGYFIYWAK